MTDDNVVVVLRPLGLGDFLAAVPAYRAIADAFPKALRILAAPAELHGLATLCGAFHKAVHVRPLHALPEELHGADIAIDLHGRGPASQRVLLASRPKRLIAFAHADIPESRCGAPWYPEEHETERWCRMLRHAGVPANPQRLFLPIPPSALAPELCGATIVHPGAASASRRWPIERWAHVVRALRARGEPVLLTGGPDERELVDELARRSDVPSARTVPGTLSLLDLAALVAHAGRVICGDTGVAHLATAYGVPSILLFGPTSPNAWGPPSQRQEHVVLWRGRTGDPHGNVIDPGLLAIEVDDVVRAIERQPRARESREVLDYRA